MIPHFDFHEIQSFPNGSPQTNRLANNMTTNGDNNQNIGNQLMTEDIDSFAYVWKFYVIQVILQFNKTCHTKKKK